MCAIGLFASIFDDDGHGDLLWEEKVAKVKTVCRCNSRRLTYHQIMEVLVARLGSLPLSPSFFIWTAFNSIKTLLEPLICALCIHSGHSVTLVEMKQ